MSETETNGGFFLSEQVVDEIAETLSAEAIPETAAEMRAFERERISVYKMIFSNILAAPVEDEDVLPLWKQIMVHKYHLSEKVGRNVGVRVAALDYLFNVRHTLRNLRGIDVFARFGGDEFCIFFPQTMRDTAIRACGRIRGRLAKLSAERYAGVLPVTLSGGLVTFPFDGMQRYELLKAADHLLYESKRAGRDQITDSEEHVLCGNFSGDVTLRLTRDETECTWRTRSIYFSEHRFWLEVPDTGLPDVALPVFVTLRAEFGAEVYTLESILDARHRDGGRDLWGVAYDPDGELPGKIIQKIDFTRLTA